MSNSSAFPDRFCISVISPCVAIFIASRVRLRNGLFAEPGHATTSSAVFHTAEAGARQQPAWLRNWLLNQQWRKPMNIDRRQLRLPALALGLLSVVPASTVVALAAAAEDEAVAEKVEAFRAAQFVADAKALDALCAAELSYSHSSGVVEDKATFIANATNGKPKFLSLRYQA